MRFISDRRDVRDARDERPVSPVTVVPFVAPSLVTHASRVPPVTHSPAHLRRGFTLIEVLLAAIILGAGLAGILVSMSQSQKLMMSVPNLETSQEVMDLGEMAYPLDAVTDVDDIDVRETRASELWEMLTDERMTDEQEEKYHGFTWERECLDKNMSDDEKKHFNNLYRVKITVTWGDRGRGSGKKQQESYIVLWREPQE